MATQRRQLCDAFVAALVTYFVADTTVTITHNEAVATDLEPGTKRINVLDGSWEHAGADTSRGPGFELEMHVEAQVGVAADADATVMKAAILTALDDLETRIGAALEGTDPSLGGLAYGALYEKSGETVLPDDLGSQPVGGMSKTYGVPFTRRWTDLTVG